VDRVSRPDRFPGVHSHQHLRARQCLLRWLSLETHAATGQAKLSRRVGRDCGRHESYGACARHEQSLAGNGTFGTSQVSSVLCAEDRRTDLEERTAGCGFKKLALLKSVSHAKTQRRKEESRTPLRLCVFALENLLQTLHDLHV